MSTITETNTALATTRSSNGEMAISASAALAKATIEAKFTIALRRPRNIMTARATILEACQRPHFAKSAMYNKPIGGGIEGLSIRFAETALQAWGNVDVSATTVFENAESRKVSISVTDLETNTSYCDEIFLNKTVERANVKPDQEILSTRTNSLGKKVYVVAATEDDLQNKVNAAKSKSIRNSGLRLLPEDIKEEAIEAIYKTCSKGGGDPQAETKKICDAFASLNIAPTELERYLGHSLKTISPKELQELRAIYTTVSDEEASWQDYMDKKEKARGPAPRFTGPATGEGDAPAEAAAGLAPAPVPKPSTLDPRPSPAPAAPPPKPTPKPRHINFLKGVRDLAAMAAFSESDVIAFLHAVAKADDSLVTLEEVEKMSPSALEYLFNNWSDARLRIQAGKTASEESAIL